MQLHRLLLTVGAVSLPASVAQAVDAVRTVDGQTISGTLNKMTEREVTITRVNASEPTTVPVNQIEWIQFDGEPAQLRIVRSAIATGNFQGARQNLANDNLDPAKIERQELKQEILFYNALTDAKLAQKPED